MGVEGGKKRVEVRSGGTSAWMAGSKAYDCRLLSHHSNSEGLRVPLSFLGVKIKYGGWSFFTYV